MPVGIVSVVGVYVNISVHIECERETAKHAEPQKAMGKCGVQQTLQLMLIKMFPFGGGRRTMRTGTDPTESLRVHNCVAQLINIQ